MVPGAQVGAGHAPAPGDLVVADGVGGSGVRGGSYANGQAMSNGPGTRDWTRTREGWDIRPVTSWSLTIGQDPA